MWPFNFMKGSEITPDWLKILLHGMFLTVLDLCAVVFSAVLLMIIGINASGIVYQMVVAIAVGLLLYFAIYYFIRSGGYDIMQLEDLKMLVVVLVISMALLPAIYYPLHYVTHGYWSSFHSMLVNWPFQFMVNSICLAGNFYFIKS